MSFTPIPRGTVDWDVPVNAEFTDLDNRVTANETTDATQNANIATNAANIAAVTTTANNAVPKGTLTVNVKDFGAVGDGVANDTTSIQNAINSLTSNGGSVFFPPGSYLLNSSSGLSLTVGATRLVGASAESSKILIGSSFTAAQAVSITAANCQVEHLSVSGANGTTTSNPIADGILISGVRRAKVHAVTFNNLNGWAIKAFSTSASAFSNPLGTQISRVYMNANAGGIWFKGDTNQGWAMNSSVTDFQSYQGGVTSGANANLDCIKVEDAWDVLFENIIAWQNAGTGASFHITGTCAATFVNNLDALGPTTGVNVKVDDTANGSPQNTQISGGVIQQGSIGIQVSGGTNNFRLTKTRVFNNQTHGMQVDGTGAGIHVYETFFSQNGQGATGTNYDLNWSGTATGMVSNSRFVSPIVAVSSPGVQFTVNVAAGQNVRVMGSIFAGTGSTSANWFTNRPSAASHLSAGTLEFLTDTNWSFSGSGRVSLQPSASGNNVLATNVSGTDTNDRFRLLGSGNMQFGPGNAARDTTWQRIGVAQIGTNDSDVVIGLAGKGLQVKSGTNAKAGTVTANGTTAVTVSTTAITANSVVVFGLKTQSGTAATTAPFMSAVTAGTSFQIKSSTGDTSVYNWVILDLI